MIVVGKHLPRRTVLKGIGASVALPFLDAMTPAFAGSEGGSAPLRLAFVYVPNGVTMADWTPRGEGTGFELSRIQKPLEAFRDRLLVVSGLDQHNGNALGDGAGDHARAAASFLTGSHPRKTAGADIQNGISVDQVAAELLGGSTPFRSLELGCEDSRTVGDCDSGYSCAYTNSLAWSTPTTPLPPEVDPRMAFERLFGGEDADLDPETRARRARYRKSVLDVVRGRAAELHGTLGAGDRRKLDEYLHGIREIERRIELAEATPREIRPDMERPRGIPAEFADYVKLVFDLQVAAFQADLSRVATTMIAREGSANTYPEIGVPEPHHPLTHHRENPEWVEKVTRINTYHVELFGHLLSRLAGVEEAGESLLDHSVVVYGSGLSDGNRHVHESLPVLLAGRGGGLLSGRHRILPQGTPLNDLFLTVLQRAGSPATRFGDSRGPLEGLFA
jgi:hypothetical protein